MSNKWNIYASVTLEPADQPQILPSNQVSFKSPVNDNYINIVIRLIKDNVIFFQRFYEPISDISIIQRDALKQLNINITLDNINYVSEIIFYSLMYNSKASKSISPDKDEAWALVDKNILNAFINNILNSNFNIDQTTSLGRQIWWFIEVNPLVKKWCSFVSTKTFHLIYDSQNIIDNINKLTSHNRKIDIDAYFIMVKNLFQSLLIIDNSSNLKDGSSKHFSKKLEQQIKAYETILGLKSDYVSHDTIMKLDPTLAHKHPLIGINHKNMRKDVIHLRAILAKTKIQKAGVLSKSNATNRALLCLLLLAQIFGIKMHQKVDNFSGSKMRKFMRIVLGGNLYEKYGSKLKAINSIYSSDLDIINSVDSLTNQVNSSPNYCEAIDSAYLSFASYLTEII